MKRKITLILSVICVTAFCMGLTACGKVKTPRDELIKEGYDIFVTYDTNDGSYIGHTTMIDVFKSETYTADGDGKVNIKLLDPTDPRRGTSSKLSLAMQNYFYVGWYKERTVKRNENKQPVDDNDNVLLEDKDGFYVLNEKNERVECRPAYIYSGRWDFDTDTVEYTVGSGVKDLRLYAAWVPYFEYRYWYEKSEDNWVCYGSTSFNYKTVSSGDPEYAEDGTIWLPRWDDGAMNYRHQKNNQQLFDFPSLSDKTFNSAYHDKAKTQQITETAQHEGSIDYEHGVAVKRVKDIYTVLDNGRNYRIETVDQFIKYANPRGNYEIYNDLDFTDKAWPAALMGDEFVGSIYGKDGKKVILSNINATFTSEAVNGGLFGTIKAGAKIDNVVFDNVIFYLKSTKRNAESNFGFFAGFIEDGVTLNASVTRGRFDIGNISLGSNYNVNLIANGNVNGLTVTNVGLRFVGELMYDKVHYEYVYSPEKATVDDDKNIILTRTTSKDREQEYAYYDVEITEV